MGDRRYPRRTSSRAGCWPLPNHFNLTIVAFRAYSTCRVAGTFFVPADYMYLKQFSIGLLLGYLVLLLNLGPSLHRAHIFGLHAAQLGSSGHTSSCCGHCHSSPSHPHGHSAAEESQQAHDDHDCAFCKFFDQYHVVRSVPFAWQSLGQMSLQDCLKPSALRAESFSPIARGPPSCPIIVG
jgi:hypothetical protein